MIGIIGAMDSEVDELKKNLSDVKVKLISGINFYEGSIYNKKIVLAKCGVGKVFAAICAEAMILNYSIDKIIHIGIAGSLDKSLRVGDVVIASSVVHHDLDTTGIGEDRVGMISGLNIVNIPCSKNIVNDLEKCAKKIGVNYKIGVVASGDQFINNNEAKQKIINSFDAIACEMEGASTGQVCYVNKIDFCVARCFSDSGDDNANDEYEKQKIKSSDVATRLIKEYLKC